MRSRLAALLAVLALVLVACSSSSGASPSASAAASAVASTTAPASAVASTAPSAAAVDLTISTDASSALEAKIEQGAPADVFLSADTTNPQKLVDKALASGSLTNFAKNKLTVIVPKDNPAKLQTPEDLAKSGVKVIAAGDAVPITKYATQLVGNLAKEPGYPANFVAAYDANIASKEDNVGAIVAKVGTGEGDAGIVYVTDATGKDVAAIAVPPDANVIATYAGAVLKSSANPSAASTFLTWLAGPDGQATLSGFGFLPPT